MKPLEWFIDWYDKPKYNITFQFPIELFYHQRVFDKIQRAYTKAFSKTYNTPFVNKPIDMFLASRLRTCPFYLYTQKNSLKGFKNSHELSPRNETSKKYNNYSKVLMNYGPWKKYWGENAEFDAIEYWIKVLGSKFPNNPYTLCPTAYVPFLFEPWIKNPNRPPLSGRGTLCIWNLRPIIEDKKLSVYAGWRQSRLTYFLGNIFGILDIFNIVCHEVEKQYGKGYPPGRFYGHIVGRENDCKRDKWDIFQTELYREGLVI